MPSLNSLELTYLDLNRWYHEIDGNSDDDFQENLTGYHLEFLKHTEAAVCKWRGSMDWNVLEQKQIPGSAVPDSFVRLMRYRSAAVYESLSF